MTTDIMPNDTPVAATDTPAVPSMDSIAQKMTAMREQTQRNQMRATEQAATGVDETPVAPDEPKITRPEDQFIDNMPDADDAQIEAVEPDEPSAKTEQAVSEPEESNSTAEELIDFIEFAETNPNAKFKFMRNGKEVVIDAKKAASILGQGGAIHEEARQLKIEKAEFDEFQKEHRQRQEGLTLAMEFSVQPQLQKAYDEIIKVQGYQATFQQQLAATTDPAQQARIMANMQNNEKYLENQSAVVNQLKPALDTFYDLRKQQVTETLDRQRKSFTDKELKNEYIYNELREKIGKTWTGAKNEILPGIKNIDLISSDETLLGLIRDGLKFRSKPTSKAAGASLAGLTQTRGSSMPNNRGQEDNISKLREQAKAGDKKAGDNLLMAQLSKIRSARTGR
jgi:hypothetical protein